MKKLLCILLCLVICGCHKTTTIPASDDSYETLDESLAEPWFDQYTMGSMTLDIEDTDDYEDAVAFTFSNGHKKYDEYAFLVTDTTATCDLGEDGIVITFEKSNEGIDVGVEGDFYYLDGENIAGFYRR